MATAQKPRLLSLCRHNPWPPVSGARLRNYWSLVALSQTFLIDLVAVSTRPEESWGRMAPLCERMQSFQLRNGLLSRVTRAVKPCFPRNPYFVANQITTGLCKQVRHLLDTTSYQAIHVSELAMSLALPKNGLPPLVVYDAHNCESDQLAQRVKHEPPPVNTLIRIDVNRVRRLERDILERADLVTLPSPQDIDDLAAICPATRSKAVVVPNGVDSEHYAPARRAVPDDGYVLLNGNMEWRPNQQGLMWFVKEVLPLLKQEQLARRLKLVVAGRMTNSFADRIARIPGLTVIPNPRSMENVLARASVVAIPIIVSSGTRLRILEAWAAGRPVVTTTAGARGLEAEPGRHLLIGDSGREFAMGILELLTDRAAWTGVRDAALANLEPYEWRNIGQTLRDAYTQALPAVPLPVNA